MNFKKMKKTRVKLLKYPKKKFPEPPTEPKISLDHKNYGAWYLHPSKWEKRFQSLSDPKSIDIVKSRNLLKKEKQNRVMGMTIQEKVKVNIIENKTENTFQSQGFAKTALLMHLINSCHCFTE